MWEMGVLNKEFLGIWKVKKGKWRVGGGPEVM